MNRAMTLADWGLLALAILLMGSTFLFLGIAVTEISPLTAAAARTVIAAPICWVVMRAMGLRFPPFGRDWTVFLWGGLLMSGIPFAAVAWGQQHVESGLVGILYGTIPLMVVVLAPVFLAEEVFTRRRLIGALIGLGGLVLVVGPSVLANAQTQLIGIAITLIAPFSQSLGTIFTRKNGRFPPPVITAGQLIAAALFLVPVAFIFERPLALTPGTGALTAMIVTGVVCTAGAMSLFLLVLSRIGAARSAVMPMLMPIVAVILGMVFLGERLPLEAFAGLALILAGAAAVGGRVKSAASDVETDGRG